MTSQTFTVRAVDHATRAHVASCAIHDFDAAYDWIEDRAGAWASRTGRTADIESSIQSEDGTVIGWERAGIRVTG